MDNFEIAYKKIIKQWIKSEPILKVSKMIASSEERPFVLYGAGRLAGVFLNACKELKISISGICDRRIRGTYEGIPIFSPTELQREYSNAMVLVCSHSFNNDICNDLRRYGFSDRQIIQYPAKYPYFESPKTFLKHKSGYEWAYNFYTDPISKRLVLDRIELYLLDKGLVPNTTSDCYYETDVMKLNEQEVFVDGGAFTGDTAEDFIERRGGKYTHIYAFEPDSENYKKAAMRLDRYSNVEVIRKGLWSTETTLSFCEDAKNPAGSCFIENHCENDNENRISVTSLDHMFSQKKYAAELPTFIKLDIEGSEKEALLGAVKIIQQTKPKLAVCAYHKIEDIYELPKTILSIRNDYHFALRQHEHGCFDTVLYAY